ncbi:MAG: TAXI family TRAP transporter solute-binding subunit [Campylobacterota bacterium]|nr:TAXI family TRAP transporter solute-binding subunit [Campylobacterota bacterium]
MKKLWILVFCILSLIVAISLLITKPTPKKQLTLATGAIGSDSYAYGISYQMLLQEDGVELKLIPTQGSLDTIGHLNAKQADIGFIHSGVLLSKKEYNFESLASIYSEPLWIFYRDEGYDINYLIEATGRKVGISTTNDGTFDLTQRLSKLNGLIDNIDASYIEDKQSLKQLKNETIDIFITLATKDNQHIQELLSDPSIKLMNIRRVKAYTQKFDYLDTLNLYEGSIDLYKNIPSKDTNLLVTTQNLVSNKNIPDELIRIFLKKVNQIHGNLTLDQLDTQINEEAKLYVLNGESWLETIFPYWIASQIDRLKLLLIPLIWLIIPLFKSIIPLYIFTIRSKIFRWYSKLQDINNRIRENKEDILSIEKDLTSLQNEIEVKTKVPPSYMGEYYNLILHVELLEKKIELRKATTSSK